MRTTAAAWAGFWIAFGLIDYAADKNGRSLCDAVRWGFHTETPAGRLAVTTALGTGTLILHRHLLKPLADKAQDFLPSS